MDNLTIVTIILGLIIGTIMLIATTYVYVKHQVFALGGSILTIFGTLLLGLSIWQSVEFTVGADGAISASFKKELENLKKNVSKEIKGSNQSLTEELSILKKEISSSATKTLSDDALSKLQTREKVDDLIEKGEYLEALKYDKSNTIALMRYIEKQVTLGEYKNATNYFNLLKKANFSGVGFSVYPDLIVAFEKQKQYDKAIKLIKTLDNKYKSDITNGYGYYSRSQQLDWLDQDLASAEIKIKNPTVLDELKSLRKGIQKTIKVLKE